MREKTKGKITSILGVATIIVAIVLLSFKVIDATEFVLVGGFGAGLIAIKDKHIGL